MFDDVANVTLRSALDGLAMRQRATADNISNLQTPRFLASRVQFEDQLRAAVASGDASAAAEITPGVARSLEPTREDGNNVNLDRETLIASETGMQYQLALRALDSKWGLLRTAIKGA